MPTIDLGDPLPDLGIQVFDNLDAPANAATVVLTLTLPDGSTVTPTGAILEDAGFGIQLVPTLQPIGMVISRTGSLTGVVQNVASVGGTLDYCWLQPI